MLSKDRFKALFPHLKEQATFHIACASLHWVLADGEGIVDIKSDSLSTHLPFIINLFSQLGNTIRANNTCGSLMWIYEKVVAPIVKSLPSFHFYFFAHLLFWTESSVAKL
jgi:hypothetical protein